VVATANDFRSLPQELLRSGRFDDMFFVDLPEPDERREIISIYLRKYLRTPVDPVLVDELVRISDGFAGSDIQSAVTEICHEAIRIGDQNVGSDYYLSCFRNVVPLLRSAPEKIEEIRQLRDRAIPASGRTRATVEQPAAARRVVLG
jgi:SpoVK/Ycf46/Vps4 family AAA+-type ATPase